MIGWLVGSWLLFGADVKGSDAIAAVARQLLLEHLPKQYEDWPGWGDQVEIVQGLKFEGQGVKTKLKGAKRSVNHGLWKHVLIWIEQPQRDLTVQVLNLEHPTPTQTRFTLTIRSPIRSQIDLQQWSNGLKLMAMTVEADAVVEARLDCEITISWGVNGLLPTLKVDPMVRASQVDVLDLKIRKIGELLRGKLADGVGDGIKGTINRQITKQEWKVADKINREIVKQQEKGTLNLDWKSVFPKGLGG